jgi:membrane associated rhomboid family serine protease
MIPIKDTVYRISVPWVTGALVAINTIVFVFELSLPKTLLSDLFHTFGLVPEHFARVGGHHLSPDDYLSFFTNMFLHGGWLHLIGNMWFLYLFGRSVEDRMGHGRFLLLYLLSGIGAGVTYFLLTPHSTVPTIGASGAIAGVMAAYVVLFPRAKVLTLIPIIFIPLFVELSAFVYVAYWFLIQLLLGAASLGAQTAEGGVAWWGHVGGFVTGIILVFLLRPAPRKLRKDYPDERYKHASP